MPRVAKGLDRASLVLILRLVEAGHAARILLGSDISRQGYWKSYGGEPGLAFLVSTFREQLLAAGLTSDQIRQIYVDNPARFLSWSHPDSVLRGSSSGPPVGVA